MAKRPTWDKNPGLTDEQVVTRFGAGTSLIQAGNGKWTIKGYTPPKKTTKPKSDVPAGGTRMPMNIAPREWVGSPGMIGSWKKEPRLNPDQYEWTKNEAGRWMARPRTELTGLNTQQRADIQNADRYAQQHQNWVNQNWQQTADKVAANNQATANSLTGLNAQLNTSVRANDPTDQALTQATQAGNAAAIAPVIANQGDQAGVIRSQGVSSAANYRAAYDAARGSRIAEYRNAMQEAAAAQREQEQQYMLSMLGIQGDLSRAELSANTDLATTGMTVDGQNARALVQAETDRGVADLRFKNQAADRAARLNIEAARIEKALVIAEANNQTKRAIALRQQAADRRKEARKLAAQGKRENAKNLRLWAERAQTMAQGRVVGKDIVSYSQVEIERTLRGMGATPEQAQAIARNAVMYGLDPVGPF